MKRRTFLSTLAIGALFPSGCDRAGASRKAGKENVMTADDPKTDATTATIERTSRMPVLFVGHGSPMNVIEDNAWSQGFSALRELVPRPSAILAISAHWFVAGSYLTAAARPKTIHDFSGFPPALYEIDYPAPGHVDLARRVRAMIGDERAGLDGEWGLDHGTWSVLRWMYPAADVPVVQLSIDRRLAPRQHLELARSLADLRQEGVLIVGSGNVVHNLRDAIDHMRSGSTATPDWASGFDETVKHAIEQRDTAALVDLWPSDTGRLAHPSPDHWLPLLYAYAASDDRDRARFPIEGFDLGSISMRSILFG